MVQSTVMNCWAVAAAGLLLALCGCTGNEPSSAPVSAAAAQPPTGRIPYLDDAGQALARGRAEAKPVLLFFAAPWCRYCREMEAEGLAQPPVVQLAERFVVVRIDAPQAPDLCRQLAVRGYPTLVFLSPDGVPLNRVTGKQSSQAVLLQMQTALQASARLQSAEAPRLR